MMMKGIIKEEYNKNMESRLEMGGCGPEWSAWDGYNCEQKEDAVGWGPPVFYYLMLDRALVLHSVLSRNLGLESLLTKIHCCG